MVIEASAGDYRYLLEKKKDGTYKCMRLLLDDPVAGAEELSDWAQLPPTIRNAFTRAQNPTA